MDKDLMKHEGAIHSRLNGNKTLTTPSFHGACISTDNSGAKQQCTAGKSLEVMSFDGDLHNFTTLQKLQLACQLCNVVSDLHKRDVIHQNIDPGHIMVSPETLNVTLVSSSTAALIGDAGRFRGLGENRYLSPESVLDNGAITCLVDVWSLGMVLAEIFTGFRPYFNHPDLFSTSDYKSFHEKNQELPRFRQNRTANVEWRVFRGKGTILEQVGVLINLATCPTPELRPRAQELSRNFKMLHAMSIEEESAWT
ncbi:glycogen synthase kinase-3-like [Ptychodera flava]|uniref:glycogen synthase kinase-3-like n=1 Tax=Ptychodera flava TaxID=63121 RepID=UPI00396A6290